LKEDLNLIYQRNNHLESALLRYEKSNN
jgi:hypothetical protein